MPLTDEDCQVRKVMYTRVIARATCRTKETLIRNRPNRNIDKERERLRPLDACLSVLEGRAFSLLGTAEYEHRSSASFAIIILGHAKLTVEWI